MAGLQMMFKKVYLGALLTILLSAIACIVPATLPSVQLPMPVATATPMPAPTLTPDQEKALTNLLETKPFLRGKLTKLKEKK